MQRGLLVISVLLTALCLSAAQNTPAGVQCDIMELIEWASAEAGTAEYWETLAIERDFELLCENVNLWVTNIAGCVAGVINFVELVGGVELAQHLEGFYNGMAMVQLYCGIAIPKKTCDINAITGCATATVLTFQQTVSGDLDDVAMACESYDMLLETMDTCFETAISQCTDAEQTELQSSYDLVFDYFRIVSDYCGATCGNYILLATSQFENCDYIAVDYAELKFEDYCVHIQGVLDCVWEVYKDCPIASPDQSTLGMTGILVYSDALGCTNNIGGVTVDDVDADDVAVVLPECVAGTIACTRSIATSLGISVQAGEYGGYDFNGVVDQANDYFDLMVSGQWEDICTLAEDVVWGTVVECTDLIVDTCPVGSTGDTAQMIINTDIATIIADSCSEGCVALQAAIEGYLSCTEYLRTEELDITETSIDILTGLITPGGSNIEICEMVQGYAECILPAVQGCAGLYDNYVALVTMYSNVELVIGACNIELNLATGEIDISEKSNNALIYWSDGNHVEASAVAVFGGALITALYHL